MTRAPPGLPGASRLRAVPVEGQIWLIVGDVPTDRYSTERIEHGLADLDWLSTCGLAHEAVVEHFMKGAALVPLKMFTIFATEDRAIAHVRRRRGHLERLMERVADCREWGVRLVRDRVGAPTTDAGRDRPRSGAEFLQSKRRARTTAQALSAADRRAAEQAHRTLRRHARAATRREREPGWSGRSAPLLHAAYLVEGTGARFRSAARQLAREASAKGYRVTVTGPWPPYHFVGSKR